MSKDSRFSCLLLFALSFADTISRISLFLCSGRWRGGSKLKLSHTSNEVCFHAARVTAEKQN
jgi:hypothetical protein